MPRAAGPSPPSESRTIELTRAEVNQSLLQGRLFLGACATALIGLALFAGALPLLQFASALHSPTPNNLGTDILFLLFFGSAGGTLIFLIVGFLRTRASELVIDSGGLRFRYPNGGRREFRWADPELRVAFDDWLVPDGLSKAGARRVRFAALRMDKTYLPPALFDEICAEAQRHGVHVIRASRGGPIVPRVVRVTLVAASSGPRGALKHRIA